MIEEKRWAAVRAQLAYTEAILNGETASALGAYFDVYHRAVEANRERLCSRRWRPLQLRWARANMEFSIRVLRHYCRRGPNPWPEAKSHARRQERRR